MVAAHAPPRLGPVPPAAPTPRVEGASAGRCGPCFGGLPTQTRMLARSHLQSAAAAAGPPPPGDRQRHIRKITPEQSNRDVATLFGLEGRARLGGSGRSHGPRHLEGPEPRESAPKQKLPGLPVGQSLTYWSICRTESVRQIDKIFI